MDPADSNPKPFVFPVMKKAIEKLFTKARITKEDIESFQDRYWEQLVPNFSQALKLLDIHGVSRHSILWSINDRLLEAIKTNVDAKAEDPDQRKCQKLWQKLIKTGMVYIHHPYMRSLIMQVLGKTNSIKERHVNLIVDNSYLYDDAPLPVLRHIWVAHPQKFQEELQKVIDRFQNNLSDALLDALFMAISSSASCTADLVPLLHWTPRRRRRDGAIVRIVEMIGGGHVLYEKIVNVLREECTRSERMAYQEALAVTVTSNPSSNKELNNLSSLPKRRRCSNSSGGTAKESTALDPPSPLGAQAYIPLAFIPCQPALISAILCTLRFDLLMSLNEAKVDKLCISDRIHRIVWGLDACVRNRRIDPRHASGLAYHLTVQRQRAKRISDETSVANEEAYEESVQTDTKRSIQAERTKFSKPSTLATSKSSSAKNRNEEEAPTTCSTEDSTTVNKDTEVELLEKDVHMACHDPWVLYTLCSSLIRYTLNGLYEDRLPRDIPEVSLLAHFLVLGLGDELDPPISPTAKKDSSKSLKRSSSPFVDEETTYVKCPMKALVGYILPAVGQLQVLTWRAQLAEEMLATCHHLWPDHSPGSAFNTSTTLADGTATSGPGCSVRKSSVVSGMTSSEECAHPSTAVQKQLAEAVHSTSVTLPQDYLVHPIGYLILQYHALFALERNELTVLRVLLKAAAAATTHHSRATRSATRSTPNKTGTVSSPTTSSSPTSIASQLSGAVFSSVCFRWRPEVLQALVLCLSRLPISSPAFVDASRGSHRVLDPDNPNLCDNGSHIDVETANTENSVAERTTPAVSSASERQLGTKSGATGKSISTAGHHLSRSLSDSRPPNSVPMITRAELAMLLRGSLTLVNDLNLLALAQLAFLVPGPQLGTAGGASGSGTGSNISGSSSTATTAPTTPDTPGADTISFGSQFSDRERLVNVLARHCASTVPGEVSEATSATLQVTGSNWSPLGPGTGCSIYKSSNPRVLRVLDLLRKDIEKSLNPTSVSMSSGPLSSGVKSNLYGGYGHQTPFLSMSTAPGSTRFGSFHSSNQSDAWSGATPRSPTCGRYVRSLSTGSGGAGNAGSDSTRGPTSYSSTSRFDQKGSGNLTSAYQSSSVLNTTLPIGTPLTNPGQIGLGGATPSLSNLVGMIPPTPRRPSTPPREFLPPSPAVTTSTTGLMNFNLPSHLGAYGTEFQASCPSPSVHRSSGTNSLRTASQSYSVRPRSPSPSDS